ncbi:hypothetical protein BB048_10215 [Vibrio parahaemolyticus]|uniref:hypothetical protein n=1 Tax=Vibrio parahaemolyticus TaxID=670 RepID=UPI0008DA4DEF|nr:hypothetical protein [Vibrio parahaemolyticus]OHX38910.1 hypothetical protein BB048_10215 [Vibrio parahaemolyticus]
MKNADIPVMPMVDEFGMPFNSLPKELCTTGLTKREYFALHAPEVPSWFKEAWGATPENERFISPIPQTKKRLRISNEGMAKLERDWRYKFADLMLDEDCE